MEVKKKIIVLLIMALVIPINALAGSVTVDLDCPASANKNSEVMCQISASSDTNLAGIQFNYDLKDANYQSFTPEKNWSVYSNSSIGVSLGIDATTEKVVVGSLKIGVGTTNATVSLTKIQGTNNSYETLNGNNISKTIRIKSDINTLQTLTVEGLELNPKFDSNISDYTIKTDNDSIKIDGIANANATIKGLGTFNLKYGLNTYNIEVTSESGIKKVYKIDVTRNDKRSSNCDLKKLTIDEGNIKFNKNTTTYNIEVEPNVSKINISAEKEDANAKFVDKYGPRKIDLKYGNNKIEIKVQAENQTIKVYTINVNRKDNRSDNANLKNIIVNPGNLVFDSNKDTFELTVKSDVNKIEINPEVADSHSKVIIDNQDLKEGLNKIKITVIAENGNKKIYTINVTKLKPGEGLSDNNNIKRLDILNHELQFDVNNTSYKVTVSDEKELVFNIEMEDENATYEILNNHDLENGSLIKVIVKSESGNIKEYNFTIEKVEKINEKSNNIMLYIIIVILLILIGVMIIIIFKKNNNKKKVLSVDEII